MSNLRLITFILGSFGMLHAAVGVSALGQSRHERAKASDAPQKLNVLMLAVDDLRPMLGCYGDELVHTPNIDRLAQRAVVFDRAYCQIAKCGPSRLSLLNGLRPDTTGVYDHRVSDLKHFRQNHPTHVSLPRRFTNAGYYTQAFGKIYHDSWDVASDWSNPSMPGRDSEMLAVADLDAIAKVPFDDRATVPTVIRPRDDCPAIQAPDVPDDALFAGQMTKAAISALRNMNDKSFFLAVGYRRPHLPFVAPKRYFDSYKPTLEWLPADRQPPRDAPIMAHFNSDAYVSFARRVGLTMPNPPQSSEQAAEWAGFELRSYQGVPYHGEISDELQLRLRQAYMACVSYVDAQIGLLLDELERLQLNESTIVVLWSDHGWHLGEHASWGKMTNYEFDTQVPFIIAAPGVKPNRTRSIVELVDLYPTLCDLCQLEPPIGLDGRSIVSALREPNVLPAKPAFSQFTRFRKYMGRAVRTERHRYVRWTTLADNSVAARELYDHQVDAGETINLAGRAEHRAIIQELDALLPLLALQRN
ncbi:MAG: sulfatase [Planctomycetes bacterium]|nr:sulfatase [Planctomycetota bacterium]